MDNLNFDKFYDPILRYSDLIFWDRVWIFSSQERTHIPGNVFKSIGYSILLVIKKTKNLKTAQMFLSSEMKK